MIVSIGEVVWDIFQDKIVLGGAPVNVAYHLHTLGFPVLPISRVGRDELGVQTVDKLTALGVPLNGIQQDHALPTGRVNVTMDERNEPRFDIVAPAAWDNLDLKQALAAIGDNSFAMVFGTLGQRDARSLATIRALWAKASFRYYDVNLRPPFTTWELVRESLTAADLVKVNEHELGQLAAWSEIDFSDQKKAAQELRNRYNCSALVVTEGAAGAWLAAGDGIFSHPGFSVQVADTVGSGDAFFATLIAGINNKLPWQECLENANRRGSYVASQHGATPAMPADF